MNGPDVRSITPAGQMDQDRERAKGRHQLAGLWRREQAGQGGKLLRSSAGERQQRRDVVIAEQAPAADARPQSHHRQRVRPAVDQIAQAPQLVPGRIEPDRLQEPVQLPGTTLHITHQPAHVSSDGVKELT
jgi:hypothetical protein